MAKSYKHTPIIKSSGQSWRKHSKRLANKTVRKYKGYIMNGKSYKKLYSSYEIYDYISLMSFSEWMEFHIYLSNIGKKEDIDTTKLRDEWERYYYRK